MANAAKPSEVPRMGMAKDHQVADFLLTTRNQLARLRFEGKGPNYCKLGRSVRYRWEDVHRWVEQNVQTTNG